MKTARFHRAAALLFFGILAFGAGANLVLLNRAWETFSASGAFHVSRDLRDTVSDVLLLNFGVLLAAGAWFAVAWRLIGERLMEEKQTFGSELRRIGAQLGRLEEKAAFATRHLDSQETILTEAQQRLDQLEATQPSTSDANAPIVELRRCIRGASRGATWNRVVSDGLKADIEKIGHLRSNLEAHMLVIESPSVSRKTRDQPSTDADSIPPNALPWWVRLPGLPLRLSHRLRRRWLDRLVNKPTTPPPSRN